MFPLELFIFTKKRQDIFLEKKSWIRRFGIRENMSRTCYKYLKKFLILKFYCYLSKLTKLNVRKAGAPESLKKN